MKKVLVLILSLAMVLGCFSFAGAASYTDVTDATDYATAIAVLSDLGVLSGNGDGTFSPEGTFTRAQACTVVVKLLGYADYASTQTATVFSDVPASHWASGWIKFATDLGIVAGYGDGTFGPDDSLTYNQWLTIVLRALGYKDAKLAGTWPTNVVVQAKTIGLVDGSELTGNTAMTRAEMAEVAYNALELNYVYYDEDGVLKTNTGSDFLTANGIYPHDDQYVTVEAAQTYSILADYVGTCGTVYTNAKQTKVYAFAKDEDITSLTGKVSSDKKSFVTSAGDTYYFVDDDGKYTATTLVKGIVNGRDTAEAVPSAKKLTLVCEVSGSKITDVYSYSYWTGANTVQLSSSNAKYIKSALSKTSYTADVALTASTGLSGYKLAIDDDGAVDTSLIVNADLLSSVKEDDVLTVYADDNKYITRVEVSDKTVTGSVTKKAYNSTYSAYAYTIGGTAYYVSSLTGDALNVQTDITYIYYLDANGYLFSAEKYSTESVDYAVVLSDYYEASASTVYSTYSDQVYLLTADGTAAVYKVEADYSDDLAALYGTGALDDIFDKGTLVKFTADDDGEIVSLVPYEKKNVSMTVKSSTLGGYLLADDVFFVVPNTSSTSKPYKLGSLSSYKTSTSATIAYYATDSDGKLAAVVVSDGTASATTKYAVLTEAASVVLNSSGTRIYEAGVIFNAVSGTYNGKTTASGVTMDELKATALYEGTYDGTYLTFTTLSDTVGEDFSIVATTWTDVLATSGTLVDIGTETSPNYVELSGATVYVAQYADDDEDGIYEFTNYEVGSVDDIAEGVQVAIYKDSNCSSSAYANIVFVVTDEEDYETIALPLEY